MSKEVQRYNVRICETYISHIDVDVPNGMDPHDYIEQLCSNGEIDVTHQCDDFTRSVSDIKSITMN